MTLTFKFEVHALKQLKLAGIKPMTIVEEYEFVWGIHLTYLTLRSNLRSKVMKLKVAIKWKFGLPGSETFTLIAQILMILWEGIKLHKTGRCFKMKV